jgi:hypothetical protein
MESSGGQLKTSLPEMEKGALDTTDSYMGANQVPEKLDRQCETMKVRMLAGGISSAQGK